MGFLTTFTVYNDDCDKITKNPKKFANEIYDVCCNPNIKLGRYVFDGVVIPQRTRHADDKCIYVHAGNTVCELNSYSNITKQIMKYNPEFFLEMLEFAEANIKQLKKEFKELNKE